MGIEDGDSIFTAEEIAKFKAAGQWPPPEGVILRRQKPDASAVSVIHSAVESGKTAEEVAALLQTMFHLRA